MFETDPWYQRLFKYSVLLSLKEGYLFLRNGIGLLIHPFKTLRALFREQDFSQILLVLAFPAYLFVGGLGLIWFARRWVGATPGIWGLPTKGGVFVTIMVSFGIFLYVGYWLYEVWKVKRKISNSK